MRFFGVARARTIGREREREELTPNHSVLFSRSLGDHDAHTHLGISAEPEMAERDLGENDKFIILASDGVWDYSTNEEILDLCVANADPLKACDAIVALSSQRWDERDADHRRDDITVMIIKLDVSSAPAADAQADAEAPPAAAAEKEEAPAAAD